MSEECIAVLTKFNILVILLKTSQHVVELVIQNPPIVEMRKHHQQFFFPRMYAIKYRGSLIILYHWPYMWNNLIFLIANKYIIYKKRRTNINDLRNTICDQNSNKIKIKKTCNAVRKPKTTTSQNTKWKAPIPPSVQKQRITDQIPPKN